MRKDYRLSAGRLVDGVEGDAPVQMFINPDEAEKQYLVNTLKIDEHTLASALDPDELSRLEFEPDHVAIIFKRPKSYSGNEQFAFKVASTGVFLFKDRLILILSEELPLLVHSKQMSKMQSPQDVAIKVIYASIFHFLEHLKIINMISDELEHQINASLENKHLIHLFTLEKSLVYYVSSINSNTVLIEKLKNAANKIGFTQEQVEFLDDIFVENMQCYRQAEIYSNILAGLMDARVSIVSNNLNTLMKTLNIITIGIMVPTLVVSIFSMNLPIPLQTERWMFGGVMGLCLVSVGVFMGFWKLKKW